MRQYLLVVIGGGLGAAARFGISKFINQATGGVFPWGTMTVNFIGLFLIGFLFELFERSLLSSDMRAFTMIGFLGGLTTFSSYGLETLNLFRDGELGRGLWNMALSNGAGLVFVVAGIIIARLVIRNIS